MKLAIFLFDGVGIRNFGFSGFYEKAIEKGYQITYFNGTPFPLQKKLGFPEIKIKPKTHPLSDSIKTLKQQSEVYYWYKKTGKSAYLNSAPKLKQNNFKQFIKNSTIKTLIPFFANPTGRNKLEHTLTNLAQKTAYFHQIKKQLKQVNPDLILITHQRPIQGIEPIVAAKELKIPSVGFIFSWDNLPKGTLNVKTDFYLVWSEYMKKEMEFYYPEINKDQIFVTGTPQFEIHFNELLRMDRKAFFEWIGVDPSRKFILFSGDDITTSPNDPYYLEDLAKEVRKFNQSNSQNIHILFRPVPVDFSDRYAWVEKKYSDVITRIQPLWKNVSEDWTSYFPAKDDNKMLYNLAEHCEAVFNVGSSMVFDFVAHNKPTVYFNYNTEKTNNPEWDIHKIYQFIHFESMPNNEAVLWANSKEDLLKRLADITEKKYDLTYTKQWFDTINLRPQSQVSNRILTKFREILKSNTDH